MTDENKLLAGEFKGITLRIRSAGINGGRKFVKKEFPNRDTQTIEDLGLKPRSYQLEIIISDIGITEANQEPTQDYFDYRDRLIAAIENKGRGVLIHPFYGRIENIVATTFSISSENLSQFGFAVMSVSFEPDDDTGIPRQSTIALAQIVKSQVAADADIIADVTENYSVSKQFKKNFADAADKVNSIIDAALEATRAAGPASDQIDQFSQFIGNLSNDVNNLVKEPNELGLSISNLFNNMDGLFGTIESTAEAFQRMFDFGNDDVDINPTTFGRIERISNRSVLNGITNAFVLSHAYTQVSQLTFTTVDEIQIAEDELEVQYQRVKDGGASADSISALTDTRLIIQALFDEQRLTAKQVITVNTNRTTARLLSYKYYGVSTLAREIIALNKITDISFIEGDIKILTS